MSTSASAFRAFAIALICVGALATSGCAPEAVPGHAGEPTVAGEPLHVENPKGWDVRAWADGETLVVTTEGSGSCPYVPTIDEVDQERHQVAISVSMHNPDGACSDDLVMRTFDLDAGRSLVGYAVQVSIDVLLK